jgi:hypothetical protein
MILLTVFLTVIWVGRLYSQQMFLSQLKDQSFALNHASIKDKHIDKAGVPIRWFHGDSLFNTSSPSSLLNDFTKAYFIQYADKTLRESILDSTNHIWDYIYRSDAHFFEKYGQDFFLQIDPLMCLGTWVAGSEGESYTVNGRGILFNAGIGQRLKVYSSLQEIQRSFPEYVDQFISNYGSVPGAVFTKGYSSDLYNIKKGRDYNIARAILQYKASDWLQFSLGHDNNFIGNGYRSLLLSDFSAPYFHFRVNTHIGKLHYQNLFAELQAEGQRDRRGDLLLTKKYFVNHYLGFSLLENLNVGLSETVVFSRSNQFELQYLNPIIFYRSVEQSLGSPDNVILGMNVQWDILERTRVYGQFTFDEFKFRELFIENQGWWGNKWGSQIGVLITDVGLKQSLLRLEWNRIRPYTYQHRDSISNYTHARQPLAHPSGANLNEWLVEWTWNPSAKWHIRFLGMYQHSGYQEESNINTGSDPNQDFSERTSDYEIYIVNGPSQNLTLASMQVRRRIWKTLNLSLEYRYRKQEVIDLNDADRKEQYLGMALIWNWQQRDFSF